MSKVTIKTVTMFETSDGMVFETLYEANAHQGRVDLQAVVYDMDVYWRWRDPDPKELIHGIINSIEELVNAVAKIRPIDKDLLTVDLFKE